MSEGNGADAAADFATRLDRIRHRIDRCSVDPGAVRIVAVTKGFGPEAVRMALAAGLVDVGENYADELLAKAGTLAGAAPSAPAGPEPAPTWHFLGAVQRNKVPRLAPVVAWWQGVRRLEEGRAIARRAPGSTVLVQVNLSGRPERLGCGTDDVPALVTALRDEDLEVAGLMGVGPGGPPDEARPGFATLSALADGLSLPVRSMGMSDDLEVALAEGSTMLRLGRALFGERPARPGHDGPGTGHPDDVG